eukprot:m51a1_g7455 hypothetical protein (907) ;mRNA; r:121709-127094
MKHTARAERPDLVELVHSTTTGGPGAAREIETTSHSSAEPKIDEVHKESGWSALWYRLSGVFRRSLRVRTVVGLAAVFVVGSAVVVSLTTVMFSQSTLGLVKSKARADMHRVANLLFASLKDLDGVTLSWAVWRAWKTKYSRSYATPESEEHRYAVFRANVAEYARRNAEQGQTAVYGPDKFADLSPEEFASQYLLPQGVQKSEQPEREAPSAPQYTCGSCWAFTSSAVLEGAYLRANRQVVVVSPQNMVDCASYANAGGNWDGCRGFNVVDMLAEIADAGRRGGGVALESQYPYRNQMGRCQKSLYQPGAVTAESYFTERFDEAEGSSLYSRLMQYGPLGIGLNAGMLQGYRGGIVRQGSGCLYTQQGYYGPDHAVTLVGWGQENGVKYWLIKNSWGADWGEPKDFAAGGPGQGFFRIQRGVGACHLTKTVAAGAVVKGGAAPDPEPQPDPQPQPGPKPCVPRSREAACGSRRCGSVDNGCGSPLTCGYCANGQACSAAGVCAVVDNAVDWGEFFPPGGVNDFGINKGPEGVTLMTVTTTPHEKRAVWATSGQFTSESWTSFSVDISATSAGVVGIGMRNGQPNANLNGIAWKIYVPQYWGGATATAYLLECFYYGSDQCNNLGSFAFGMNAFHNFTVNFGLQYNNGWVITMQPWLDGWDMTGGRYYTIARDYYPAVGNAFIVASGAGKTFRSPRLRTKSTVRVAMKSCHTGPEWSAEVARILRVPDAFIADVRGQRSPASSCGYGTYDTFNVTLLDSNATLGILGQAAAPVSGVQQLTFSNALASQLTEAVAGGGLENMGIVGAEAAAVFPVAAGEAVASAALAAAGAGLSAGAIVGIVVGGAVALAVVGAVAGVVVYRHATAGTTTGAESSAQPAGKAPRGVDVMSGTGKHQSITGRSPPVAV